MKTQRKRALPTLEQIETERDRLRGKNRTRSVLRSTVYTLIVVAAVAILVATLWLPFLRIYGTSMTPTLEDGQIVVCYKTESFEPGEIVAFYYNNKILVKRVIGMPGDWIDISEDGTVSVNGTVLDEPYISERSFGAGDLQFPYQVPESAVFVLGDHRATSVDSRYTTVGCVPQEQIVGRLLLRLWPLDHISTLA